MERGAGTERKRTRPFRMRETILLGGEFSNKLWFRIDFHIPETDCNSENASWNMVGTNYVIVVMVRFRAVKNGVESVYLVY